MIIGHVQPHFPPSSHDIKLILSEIRCLFCEVTSDTSGQCHPFLTTVVSPLLHVLRPFRTRSRRQPYGAQTALNLAVKSRVTQPIVHGNTKFRANCEAPTDVKPSILMFHFLDDRDLKIECLYALMNISTLRFTFIMESSRGGIRRVQSSSSVTLTLDMPVPDLDDSFLVPQKKSPIRPQKSTPGFPQRVRPPIPVMPLEGNIPHISTETMAAILRGEYDHIFDRIIICDCRFVYEYEGGHIKSAIHIADPSQLRKTFFSAVTANTAFIFHCEFSSCRGPEIASLFRKIDRKLNENFYPRLHYPHVFVLHGGYKDFYEDYPEHCEGGYVRMTNPEVRENGVLAKMNSTFKHNLETAKDELGIRDDHDSEKEPKKLRWSQRNPVSPLIKKSCRRRTAMTLTRALNERVC